MGTLIDMLLYSHILCEVFLHSCHETGDAVAVQGYSYSYSIGSRREISVLIKSPVAHTYTYFFYKNYFSPSLKDSRLELKLKD